MLKSTLVPKYYLLVVILLLISCKSFAPTKVAVWNAPKRFTQDEVFKASIQAGLQQGYQINESNAEHGIISFRRKLGNGERNLSVTVKQMSGVIKIKILTSANSGGIISQALAGSQVEMTNQFYRYIY